jgi:hypothetical protein
MLQPHTGSANTKSEWLQTQKDKRVQEKKRLKRIKQNDRSHSSALQETEI